jgi:hypothetical protein
MPLFHAPPKSIQQEVQVDRRTFGLTAIAGLASAAFGSKSFASEPAVLPNIQEKLNSDTKKLYNTLQDVRFGKMWKSPELLKSCAEMNKAIKELEWINDIAKNPGYDTSIDPTITELRKQMDSLREISELLNQGKTFSPIYTRNLIDACGLAKGIAIQTGAGRDIKRTLATPPQLLIYDVMPDPISGEVTVNYSFRDILIKFAEFELTPEYYHRMSVGIANSESGKVEKLSARKEPNFMTPVLYIDFSNNIKGRDKPLIMHMRQTLERKNLIGAVGGWSSGGELEIWNKLLEEAPYNENFVISQYYTCLKYCGQGDKTKISFAANSELTFYGKRSPSDAGYRNNYVVGARERLLHRKNDALTSAERLLKAVFEKGSEAGLKEIALPS